MNFLKRWFSKKPDKPIKELLDEIIVGDLVELEFKTAKEIGILGKNVLALSRLNKEEIDQKKFNGVISNIQKYPEPLSTMVVEITVYNSPSMPGRERRITFLQDEIKNLRKING